MALVFTKGMEAKFPGGLKAVQYEVSNTLDTHAATINAKDIGLSTIMWMSGNQLITAAAAASIRYVVTLGSFTDGKGDANYATIAACGLGTTRVDAGTFQIFALGL